MIYHFKFKDNLFKVIGTSGDAKLGGDDLDQLLLDYILNTHFESIKNDLSHDLKVSLKRASKSIKENYSP